MHQNIKPGIVSCVFCLFSYSFCTQVYAYLIRIQTYKANIQSLAHHLYSPYRRNVTFDFNGVLEGTRKGEIHSVFFEVLVVADSALQSHVCVSGPLNLYQRVEDLDIKKQYNITNKQTVFLYFLTGLSQVNIKNCCFRIKDFLDRYTKR